MMYSKKSNLIHKIGTIEKCKKYYKIKKYHKKIYDILKLVAKEWTKKCLDDNEYD